MARRRRPKAALTSSIAATASRSALQVWRKPGSATNGEEVDTVAIVTAPASPDLAVLHPRVPVTIAPDDFERWLDGLNNDAESVMPLLVGPRPGECAWHEISTRVNAAANGDAQLILPITEEERAAEEPKPAKEATRRKPAAAPSEDGQGTCSELGRPPRKREPITTNVLLLRTLERQSL